jgi:hypothetical protein
MYSMDATGPDDATGGGAATGTAAGVGDTLLEGLRPQESQPQVLPRTHDREWHETDWQNHQRFRA